MSIHSMTGFANAAGESGGRRINLDIRAVNHRYLDVQFKMPDDLRHLESALQTMCERQRQGLPPASFDVPALPA